MGQEYVKAWNAWGDFLAEQMKKKRALAQFVHGSSARCMRTWAGFVLERREKLHRMSIVAKRLTSKMDDALNTWKEFIEELRLKRKSLARLVYSSQWKGLHKWQTYASERAERYARMVAVM